MKTLIISFSDFWDEGRDNFMNGAETVEEPGLANTKCGSQTSMTIIVKPSGSIKLPLSHGDSFWTEPRYLLKRKPITALDSTRKMTP